jgi:hypothetical protein
MTADSFVNIRPIPFDGCPAATSPVVLIESERARLERHSRASLEYDAICGAAVLFRSLDEPGQRARTPSLWAHFEAIDVDDENCRLAVDCDLLRFSRPCARTTSENRALACCNFQLSGSDMELLALI